MKVATLIDSSLANGKVSQSVADQWLIIESIEPKLESRFAALVTLTASLWCDALSAMLPCARTTKKFRGG